MVTSTESRRATSSAEEVWLGWGTPATRASQVGHQSGTSPYHGSRSSAIGTAATATVGRDGDDAQAVAEQQIHARERHRRGREDRQLPQLDAEIEAEAAGPRSIRKEAAEVVREASAVHQPEDAGEDRPVAATERRALALADQQVLRRGGENGQRDEQLDQSGSGAAPRP